MSLPAIEVTVSPTPLEVTVSPTVTDVTIAGQGLQGPPGPAGADGVDGQDGANGLPGADGGSYTHDQATASATWTVVHNLGYYPNVAVVDSAGSEVIGEISYLDVNTVEITFANAFGGKAYLS